MIFFVMNAMRKCMFQNYFRKTDEPRNYSLCQKRTVQHFGSLKNNILMFHVFLLKELVIIVGRLTVST